MPQALSEQEPRGESLTPDAEVSQVESAPTQPVATGEQTTPASTSDATSPPEVNGQPKSDQPRDERGKFAPKPAESAPDPVAEAVAKLAKPEPKPTKTEQPGKAAPPATKPSADASTTSTPVDDLDAPEAEKAAWKPATRERFDKVLTRTKELRSKLDELEPLATHGKEYQSLLDDYNLREHIGWVPKEHMAGLVLAQAAINRGLTALQQGRLPAAADRDILADLGQTIDQFRSQFGVQTTTAPKAFEGELPADLKDLVEVYGVDEKRVRMLAALEAKAPATAQPPQQQQTAPVQQPQAPAVAERQEGVDMEAIYSRRFVTELAEQGDQNAAQTMRVLLAHPATAQEIIKRFRVTNPAHAPAVFNALDSKEKYEVLKAVHGELTKPKVPARPTTTLPPPTQQRTHTGAPPRRTAAEANGDPVASAISFLSRE